MNPNIILAGQQPNMLNTLTQSNVAAAQHSALQRDNRLRQTYAEHGPGIAAGDQNALDALAVDDPFSANKIWRQGVDDQRYADETAYNRSRHARADARADQELQIAIAKMHQEHGAAAVKAERDQIANTLAGAAHYHGKGDEAGYNAWLTQNGADPAQFPFQRFPAHAAQFKPVLDAIDAFKPSAPSAKDEQIRRLVESGVSQNVAVGIADGRYVTSRDPMTGETLVIDKSTGAPMQQSAPATAPQSTLVDRSGLHQTSPPSGLSYGTRFQGGDTSFGFGGAGRGAINTVADTVGAPVPFPQTQEAQADFAVFREDLLGTFAATYGRQPPSWVLQAIDRSLPKAGDIFTGPRKAQSQFKALAREFEGKRKQAEVRLGRPMRPVEKAETQAEIEAINGALAEIQQALNGIAPQQGASGASDGTTGTGITWSIK